MNIRLLQTLTISVILFMPFASQAAPEMDYEAIGAKVDLAVSVMLHKQGRPLDDDEADSIRAMSFATQLLKPSLSKIDPDLLFVCAVKEIYGETEHDHVIDTRISVNPAIVYSHAQHRYLDNRFVIKAGLSMKKVMKIEKNVENIVRD